MVSHRITSGSSIAAAVFFKTVLKVLFCCFSFPESASCFVLASFNLGIRNTELTLKIPKSAFALAIPPFMSISTGYPYVVLLYYLYRPKVLFSLVVFFKFLNLVIIDLAHVKGELTLKKAFS